MTLTEIVPRFVHFSLTNSTQNRKAMRENFQFHREKVTEIISVLSYNKFNKKNLTNSNK